MEILPPALSHQVSRFTEVKSASDIWRYALRATIACAVGMLAVGLIFGPQFAPIGLTGAQVNTTSMRRPLRIRLRILAIMDAAYVLACGAGALVGDNAILLTALFTAIAGVSALTYHSMMADPPGPIFLLIGPAIASHLPSTGMSVGQVTAILAIAAVVASLVSLGLQWFDHDRVVAQAVDDADRRVRALQEADTTDERQLAGLRDDAYAAVLAAITTVVEAGGDPPSNDRFRLLNTRLRLLHRRCVEAIVEAEMPRATIAVSAIEQRRYLGAPRPRYLLHWGVARWSFPRFASRRLALAILLTCVASYTITLRHPYWAVMTTALVMSLGTDRLSLTHRAMHRLVGTAAGLAIFEGVHLLQPSGWIVIALTLAFFLGIQVTAPRNYGLAVLFITPMALLIATSHSPGAPVGHTVLERLVDTLIGVACSLAVMWATGHRTPIALVRRQFRRTLRSVERVLLTLADDTFHSRDGLIARRNLAYEELQTARILRIAQEELPARLQGWSEIEYAVNRLSYTALAACWIVEPRRHLDADAMASALQRVIAALPRVDAHPIDVGRLETQLCHVRDAGHPA